MPNTAAPSFSGENLLCIRGERTVFAGLSFAVPAGGALILRGPNGSGKSSLLRLMAGLLQPIDGALLRDGIPVRDDPEGHRSSLHYVGHKDAIKPVLTVAENLAFWSGVNGGTGSVDTALETFGLAALVDTAARLLSAGQQRRLNLARIIASPAPLWLLDEPTIALDSASVSVMVDLIAAHRATGGIVVLSTHIDLGIHDAVALDLDRFAPEVSL
ncbi:MAG: heme ABC exporter ATP-binding protein CcmA [Alphaproteobacteria bacterium]|nr:heme ABC exporter ATP-binding protein CcmA [Alphaproteobacteria bacterium]